MSEDDGEPGTDDALAAQMAMRADHKNISYFAFTATPKVKTLELFGRKNDEGQPEPFHLYTMKQAIEENFILDVLENYTTYEMAYKIATANGADREVPKGEAAKLIARMVRLHSYTITQKVAIIVEHFRETVAPLLNGRAKAMVVTDSREAALRYKMQMDNYIKEKDYTDLQTLVAFSGTVKIDDDFPGEWTEGKMNKLRGESIPEAFDTDSYQVLIAAEKFQTGFDQPKLCAMYVDKRLDGVAAVQTLSRLNRTYNGPFGEKTTTYILDFVNTAGGIEKAFQPYYEATVLADVTDPNKVHDLIHEIDSYGIPLLYTEEGIEAFANAYFEEESSKAAKQTRLNNLIGPIKDRFIKRRDEAREANDTNAIDAGKVFRKKIMTFGRYYRFLSQLYNFSDAAIAKREIFYEYLARNIRENETGERVDITDVNLTHLRLTKTFEDKIRLAQSQVSFIGGNGDDVSTVARIKAYAPLSEVIALMNEFFGNDVSDDNQISLLAGVLGKAVESPDLIAQAMNNTIDRFALGDAPKVADSLLNETIYETQEKSSDNARQIQQIAEVLRDDIKRDRFMPVLLGAIYKTIRDRRGQPGA
jgi:type I restriction enzyme R subunit